MWGTWGPRETWGWDDGVDTVREARRKKADEEKDRAEREVIRKAYFRLEQPVHGTLLQAYWPNQDTWLPVKFVKVCLDGKYRVKWCSDGTLSDMPTDYVRKHGSDEPAQGDSGAVTIRQVLVDARPDWKERDVEASLAKLKRIGIVDARNLHEVVKAEIRGGWGGVNSMLKEENEKPFLMQTLLAMRKCGEAWLMREAATSGGAPTSELSAKTSNSKVGGHNGGAKAEPQDPAHAANVRNNFTPAERERGGASTHPADPGAQASSMEAAIAAAAMANGAGGEAEAEAAQLLVRCARGHALEQGPTPYDVDCDGCRKEFNQGSPMWRCDACSFDLCNGCHAKRVAAANHAPPRRAKACLPAADSEDPPPLQPAAAVTPASAAAAPGAEAAPEREAFCLQGHGLRNQTARFDANCTYCNRDLDKGAPAWQCSRCSYYLCDACFDEKAV